MKQNMAKGAITEMLGKNGQDDKITAFYSQDIEIILPPLVDNGMKRQYELLANELATAQNHYAKLINDNREFLEKSMQFETLILQYRCQLSIIPKFNELKQKRKDGTITYLIARAPFYEPNIKRNEIKVYMGELKDFGKDLKQIERDPAVVTKAVYQLFQMMNMRMGNTLNQLINNQNEKKYVKDFKFFRGF